MIDTTVPSPARFKWPKALAPLNKEQQRISDDFMEFWHEQLPRRYAAIENFNHTYPLRYLPPQERWRTLELGAGSGAHLAFEPLERQDYHCLELRESMAVEIRRRFPMATTVIGDCQKQIPYENHFFDRVVAIHVLEHLPDLPSAMDEIVRVLQPGGLFSVVLPCDPGLAYEFARKISAERLFRSRYRIPYRWLARREHINSPAEILQQIERAFTVFDRAYFPLIVRIVNLNLCIGLTARKPASCKLR
jgi:SAM-dependent methyltransferase